MPTIAQIMRSLFPNDPRRPPHRAKGASRLSHGIAIGCALVPLGAMLHAFAQSV